MTSQSPTFFLIPRLSPNPSNIPMYWHVPHTFSPIIKSTVYCEDKLLWFYKTFRELAFSNFSVFLNTQSQERMTSKLCIQITVPHQNSYLTRKTENYYLVKPFRLRWKQWQIFGSQSKMGRGGRFSLLALCTPLIHLSIDLCKVGMSPLILTV